MPPTPGRQWSADSQVLGSQDNFKILVLINLPGSALHRNQVVNFVYAGWYVKLLMPLYRYYLQLKLNLAGAIAVTAVGEALMARRVTKNMISQALRRQDS